MLNLNKKDVHWNNKTPILTQWMQWIPFREHSVCWNRDWFTRCRLSMSVRTYLKLHFNCFKFIQLSPSPPITDRSKPSVCDQKPFEYHLAFWLWLCAFLFMLSDSAKFEDFTQHLSIVVYVYIHKIYKYTHGNNLTKRFDICLSFSDRYLTLSSI